MRDLFSSLPVMVIIFSLISADLNSQSRIQAGNDSLKIVEKVYLHTDRDIYNPGDDIWFKAYLIEASEHHLTDFSNNLHVELISPSGEIINNGIVRMDKGLGNGDLHLSNKLKTGNYVIRAYTNYMRNYGEELFYSKILTIINSANNANSASVDNPIKKGRIDLQFFPEGGSMVDDVATVVAFKALGPDGYSVEIEGSIYTSDDEKVADILSSHNGMGRFTLKPLPGRKYYALSKMPDGETARYDLPRSFSSGIIMNVTENKEDKLAVTFKTSPEALPLYLNKDFILAVSARNVVLETYSFRIRSENNYFNLPLENKPEGILMLTLSGSDNLQLCERLVYIDKGRDAGINLTTKRKIFKQRDSVEVRISFSAGDKSTKKAFLSLSAVNDLFTGNASNSSTISSWFLLESDVRGIVEKPSYYFDDSNPDRLKDLDLLLMTQAWRDFSWKYNATQYPAEHGFTISGKVRKKLADVPLRNTFITVALFDSLRPVISTLRTDSSGRFCLEDIYLMGHTKLIASVSDEEDELRGWLVLDSSGYYPAPVVKPAAIVSDRKNVAGIIIPEENLLENISGRKNVKSFIQYSEYSQSLQEKYRLSDTIKPGEVKVTAWKQDAPGSPRAKSLHYLRTNEPDKEILITPFIKAYGTMRNYLDDVLLNPVTGMKNPVYMIDGVPMSKTEAAALPFALIERIDVLDHLASYSTFLFERVPEPEDSMKFRPADGVVSIILKDPTQYEGVKVYHSVNKEFFGYNEARIFYSPRHKTTLEKDYKPDLRTTLYWNPEIILDHDNSKSLIYYNSDNSGIFRIIVEGITESGIPVSKSITYIVE